MKITKWVAPVMALTLINNPNNQVRANSGCAETLFAQTEICLSFG